MRDFATLTQRPGADLLRLVVVGSVPHLLQLVVIPTLELPGLEDRVQLLQRRKY